MNLPLDNDTKKILFGWLAQQGVPTILLFMILFFLAYSMIVLIPEVDRQRSNDIAEKIGGLIEKQNEAIKIMADSQQKVVESHDKDRELFINLMRIPAIPKPTEDR